MIILSSVYEFRVQFIRSFDSWALLPILLISTPSGGGDVRDGGGEGRAGERGANGHWLGQAGLSSGSRLLAASKRIKTSFAFSVSVGVGFFRTAPSASSTRRRTCSRMSAVACTAQRYSQIGSGCG